MFTVNANTVFEKIQVASVDAKGRGGTGTLEFPLDTAFLRLLPFFAVP